MTLSFLESPLEAFTISINPSIAPAGSTVQIEILNTSGGSSVQGEITITDLSENVLSVILDIPLPGSLTWQVPDYCEGPLFIALFAESCQLDSTVIEVGEPHQLEEISSLDKAIEHERNALDCLRHQKVHEAIIQIEEAASLYRLSSNYRLASCCMRQFFNEAQILGVNIESELRDNFYKLAANGIIDARKSGDNAETVSCMHLLASLEAQADLESITSILDQADKLLKSFDAPDMLWCKHYFMVTRVLNKPSAHHSVFNHEMSSLSKLAKIASEGMYFALAVQEQRVRESCLDTLLPAYSQIFGQAKYWNLDSFNAVDSTYDLRLGAMHKPQKLIDRIKDALSLSPSFYNALLAGIKSFACFSLSKYDPSLRIFLRVVCDDQYETFELCGASDGATQGSIQEAVRSWLDSDDGRYYKIAISRIYCQDIEGPFYPSIFNSGPEMGPSPDIQSSKLQVLYRVKKENESRISGQAAYSDVLGLGDS